MKYYLCAMAAALLWCGAVQAQERTAGGPVETQMTWSALTNLVNAANTRTDAVNARVDQVVLCGKLGMVYAPGAAGATAQGCVESSQNGNTPMNITKIVNSLNATNTSVANILTCNKQGKVYNGTTCVNASATFTPVVSIVGNSGGDTSRASCPAGTVLVGCSGSRQPSFVDTCGEEKCGIVGFGPINGNTCQTTIDGDTGTSATVWAFCMKVN